MNLEGSLGAFGLTDVFTLLGMTGKSGALRLSRPMPEGGMHRAVVWFAEGRVTGASSDMSRQALARRVVGGGRVEASALRTALARASRDGGVVRALVDSGAVSREVAQDASEEQAVDAVCDLLRWDSGQFAVAVDESDPDDVGVSLSVADLVDRAKARQQDWDDLSDALPSRTSILGLPIDAPSDSSMRRDEWTLLAMVDGKRTFADLVELSGVGPFVAANTVAQMIRRGLIEVRDGTQADPGAAVAKLLDLLSQVESGRDRRTAASETKPSGRANAGTATPSKAAPTVAESTEILASLADFATSAASMSSPAGEQTAKASMGAGTKDHSTSSGAQAGTSTGPVTATGPSAYSATLGAHSDTGALAGGGLGSSGLGRGVTVGATAIAAELAAEHADMNALEAAIEELALKDPALNRSLLLRLIAGVRGL